MDRMARRALLALALAGFGIGTTEFVIMGLLPRVAADLGVGIPSAGLLISGYALGVALGGPLLAVLMARLPGRQSLLALVALFIIGNLGCALAPGYTWLMVARVVTAFCHAAFFGIGAVIAADLAPPGRRAQAIALMISGLTIANVLGVPFGTMIGQAAGWRTTFLGVAAIGILALLALFLWLPRASSAERHLGAELKSLLMPQVLMTLAISVIASTSMFAFFTYISPILTDVAGISEANVSWVLLACGIGLSIGNLAGARLADWWALPSLAGILAAAAAILFIFGWLGQAPFGAVCLVVLWGIFAFAACAVLQAEAVERASAAPNLASTLNISAFNLGNALGAGSGAYALSHGLTFTLLPALAGAIALAALALTGAAIWLSAGGMRRGAAVETQLTE